MKQKTAYIGGGNGFIGHHMARKLKELGYWVRVVDIKEYEYGGNDYADEVVIRDLRDIKDVVSTLRLNKQRLYSYFPLPFEELEQFDLVFSFACQMGGAGYVFTGENDAAIMHDSALINLNILETLKNQGFKGKTFYSSSACMYPQHIQRDSNNPGLKESDAYPADPDSEYGWEKLFSERLYMAYARNHGLDIRIARFHNIFGVEGTYDGGREKAPAAICRKVINAKDFIPIGNSPKRSWPVEIWGTGEQTRSFLYIDECIEGVMRLMESDHKEPINIGSDEMISIQDLAKMVIKISGKDLYINNIDGPIGVMGRNSDNTNIEGVLGWKPSQPLREGIEKVYKWIETELKK